MKRFLSLLLVFALVLSCTPVLPIQVQAATEEQSSFDGYTAISTKEELDAIRNKLLNIRDVTGSRRGQN